MVDHGFLTRELHAFSEGDFVCPEFFHLVNLPGQIPPSASWAYGMRHVPQRILPFLSLGPAAHLRDIDSLRTEGFTLLLAIRTHQFAQTRLVSAEKAASQLGISAGAVEVLDTQELTSLLPHAIRRINDHLAGVDDSGPTIHSRDNAPRKVLVFCETGNDRSAVVVIAYLMVMLNLTATEAIDIVQRIRLSMVPSNSMKSMLDAFDSILAAKRDVKRAMHRATQGEAASLGTPSFPSELSLHKRSFAEQDDNGIVAGVNSTQAYDDIRSPQNRRPPSPFRNRSFEGLT
ncbi:hypothetical protein PDE_00135 [Penicillium oxalicum 114-2]|uniref:Tyrosine specific protein phosphatases domain-containing protein n=1 Tax=Penicillium oxalicum (strain 114-2 / CGMCC 5302) TaxID=933388 RepID=S8AHK2_PENO1|nr:hypothetical protein PDE_00135 [Penicillium oxalicum 114-2]